ncbi:DUF924 domain-containing protein [Ancylothrix sp. C2]|uniref:DUF924 family protein n=1 Tax=Ancylothrix sp. D3o TaxID=2953691 RepID=UPI0021BAA1A3|nr:DUF924 family protein [Ancylothrix sp. D3o]MCT7948402.1 DUF924 domain-containing protein [Ancylothrix sp. D3o]
MSKVDEILEFWFGKSSDSNYGKRREIWFTKDPLFDEELRNRFYTDYQLATTGSLDTWQDSPRSCLALILLLDQIPRNIFRGQIEAFGTDFKAVVAAQNAIEKGFDKEMLPVERWFIYLPFEHSENMEHQRRCIELFEALKDDPESGYAIDYAIQHFKIMERFGRFPHRNAILGRESTPEEIEFLQQENSSF